MGQLYYEIIFHQIENTSFQTKKILWQYRVQLISSHCISSFDRNSVHLLKSRNKTKFVKFIMFIGQNSHRVNLWIKIKHDLALYNLRLLRA